MLAIAPVALATTGAIACVGYGFVGVFHTSALGRVVLGLAGGAGTAGGGWLGPFALHAYGGLARAVLRPREDRELAQRVQHLAQTRAEAIDSSAAELRRIER